MFGRVNSSGGCSSSSFLRQAEWNCVFRTPKILDDRGCFVDVLGNKIGILAVNAVEIL